MAVGCIQLIDDDRFEAEVLQHRGTVLVDFFTPTCGPCKQVAPILEELCTEKYGSLKILKMDATVSMETAMAHRISVVPTFVLYHAGSKVGQLSGLQSKANFEKWINSSVPGLV